MILNIDDFDIEDGTIRLSEDLLTDYKHSIDMHHIGEEIPSYSRDGVENSVSLRAEKAQDNYSLVRGEQFDKPLNIIFTEGYCSSH